MVDPREVAQLVIQERPPSTEETSTMGPLEVPELEIRERPPSTLRNIDGGPPGGAEARGPEAPTINAKKHQQRALGRCRS
jgi:hypothetical protein